MGLVLLAAGCASQPEDIAAMYVSPVQYESYSCDQVQAEMQRVSSRARTLEASLKATADTDAVQMGVGLILFWPTLFFLEGGDGPEAQEFGRLKGEKEALEKVSVQKKCGLGFTTASQPQRDTAPLALIPEAPASERVGPLVSAAGGPDGREGQELFDAGDYAGAANAWAVAARSGDSLAMRKLGGLYEDGLGVSQSFVQAHLYYNLAAARSDGEAREARTFIAVKMTPASLARAQQLAESWPGSASVLQERTGTVQTAAAPAAPGPYDGTWSLVLEYRGVPVCARRSSTSEIKISGGEMTGTVDIQEFGTLYSFAVFGEVEANGELKQLAMRGRRQIPLFGNFEESSGSGTWESSLCKGNWTASRTG